MPGPGFDQFCPGSESPQHPCGLYPGIAGSLHIDSGIPHIQRIRRTDIGKGEYFIHGSRIGFYGYALPLAQHHREMPLRKKSFH